MKGTADKKSFLCDMSWGQATFLVFLLCPLMHIFMHKGHGGHHDDGNHNHKKE